MTRSHEVTQDVVLDRRHRQGLDIGGETDLHRDAALHQQLMDGGAHANSVPKSLGTKIQHLATLDVVLDFREMQGHWHPLVAAQLPEQL